MPLMHGKGQKAFEHNIKTEMHHDKPLKQSLAIAYAMKRKAKKRDEHEDEEHKAHGGFMHEEKQSGYVPHRYKEGGFVREEKESGYEPHKYAMGGYADGGISEFEDEEKRSGYEHGKLPCPDCESGHCDVHGADMMEHGGDVVDRIMRKSMKHMSEGGRVANQEHGPNDDDLADFSRNEFDDLVLRDDLEQHYTGANSGDELDDEREDADRHDIVSRVMRSQAKKDRMAIPGYGTTYGRYK